MNVIKYFQLVFILTLLFTTSFAAEYKVPRAAYSVCAEDLDLDGDKDIVVGHNYNSFTEWSGVSILLNNGKGVFTLIDSVFLYGWQPDVQIINLNMNELPEIIAKYENPQVENEYIAIINDVNFSDITYFSLNTYKGVGYISTGDIDEDTDTDIVIASNKGQFWGILYNDGTGNFSALQYHYVDYHPTAIACGNLNEDQRNDIVICGKRNEIEVYFSYETGFKYVTLERGASMGNEMDIADMDNDGDNDMVLLVNLYLVGLTGITIYENIGNDDFFKHDEIIFQPPLSHFEISDVDNDSLPDAVCTGDSGIYVLYNQGNSNLSELQFYPINNYGEFSKKSFCADLDGNGYDDVITIRYLHAELPSNLNILFNDGTGKFIENPPTGVNEHNKIPVPSEYKLTNHPNPFNNSTTIQFDLAAAKQVTLSIYNIKGELIRNLIDNKEFLNGSHSVCWDGKNNTGKEVSSGVYLYTLRIDERIYTRKMLLVK